MTNRQLGRAKNQVQEQVHTPALDPRYQRRLLPDPSGGYTATIHELPGCIAEGDTADEALANLEETAKSWIASAVASGYPVQTPIDYNGASGRVALRISRRLHQLAVERAALEGTSLNQFIGNALASYLGQQEGMRRITRELSRTLVMVHAHSSYLPAAPAWRTEKSGGSQIVTASIQFTHMLQSPDQGEQITVLNA